MARGNRREPIFLDKEDSKQFVKALGEVCAITGCRLDSLISSIAQSEQQSEKEDVSRFAH
jgi:hypothetical protein